jgi:hypothetical protein
VRNILRQWGRRLPDVRSGGPAFHNSTRPQRFQFRRLLGRGLLGGVILPSGQSKLMVTVGASKDADLGVTTKHWHGGDQVHFGSATAIR